MQNEIITCKTYLSSKSPTEMILAKITRACFITYVSLTGAPLETLRFEQGFGPARDTRQPVFFESSYKQFRHIFGCY